MPRTEMQANPRARLMRRWPGWSAPLVAGCALLLCVVPLWVHAHKYPDFSGFWAGVDQQRYLAAARAWAAWDLHASQHHYLPFYSLMGAAFVWLTPWQPFLLPDLACLLVSLGVFLQIGRRLAPGWPAGAVAACFTVAVLGGRAQAATWVVPWSTTGSAPLQFLAVLLALRFGERPVAVRMGMFTLAAALVAGFRPSDAAVLLACGGLFAAGVLARAGADMRTWLRCGAGAAIGLAAGLSPVVAVHAAVFGWQLGPYVLESAAIGLEWQLLALRWVMVVVGPRPLLPDGVGLAAGLPWIAPGIAGMVLALQRRGRRAPAAFMASVVVLHWAVYLAYRDLQPAALWRFYNIHYFKWTMPFLVLWAARLVWALAVPGARLPAVAAVAVAAPLFVWRPVLRHPVLLPAVVEGSTIRFTLGADMGPNRTIWLPLSGGWETVYFAAATLRVGGRTFLNKGDFRLQPITDGALLLPLRQLPAGPAVLELPLAVGINPARPATVLRQGVRFALPCVLPGAVRECAGDQRQAISSITPGARHK